MSRKFLIIIAIALTAGVFFTGCELSASNSIPLVSSPMGGNSTNSGSTGIPLVQQWGTTTAIYQQTAAAGGLILSTTTPQAGTTTTTPNSTINLLTSIPPTGGAVTTTTTPFFVATVTPGRPATYILKLGEYPYCLARRFNVNQNDLLAANNLTLATAGDLPVGTTLVIPQSAGQFVGSRTLHTHPATFVVGSTDPKISTINGVACYYGDIDPSVIAAANGISLTTPLSIGRTLTIP
jgi:hypothetical protein